MFSNGNKLCSFSSLSLCEFVRSGICVGSTLEWKETATQFNVTYKFMDYVLCIIKITLTRCFLLNLRSKIKRRTTLLLHTQICSWRLGGVVNPTLPFTTNGTILIFILQTFGSYEAMIILTCPRFSYFTAHTISRGSLLLYECFWATRLSNELLR